MKRVLSVLLMVVCLLPFLTGCEVSSYKAYTYTVETGDKIKIKLDTSKGHDISKDLPFTISKDDTELTKGTFLKEEGYELYANAIETDKSAKVIDEGSKDGHDYIFYSYENKEYNYLVKVKDSDTGIIISNPNSEEEAKEIFELITISKE